jgi:hypothetical protein
MQNYDNDRVVDDRLLKLPASRSCQYLRASVSLSGERP